MVINHKHIRELRKKLEQDGIEMTGYEHTKGTHLRVHLKQGDRTASTVIALSGSSRNNIHIEVRNARRALREGPVHG